MAIETVEDIKGLIGILIGQGDENGVFKSRRFIRCFFLAQFNEHSME